MQFMHVFILKEIKTAYSDGVTISNLNTLFLFTSISSERWPNFDTQQIKKYPSIIRSKAPL